MLRYIAESPFTHVFLTVHLSKVAFPLLLVPHYTPSVCGGGGLKKPQSNKSATTSSQLRVL